MVATALQVVLNGLIAGSVYALVAVGFSLVYSTQRYFHIAHGSVVAVGAFSFYSFYKLCGVSPALALPGALVVAMVVGSLIELGVHRPLRKRGATNLLHFLASTAVFLLVQNVLLLAFGSSVRTLSLPIQEGISLGGAVVTYTQLLAIAAALVIFVALYILMTGTRFGRAVRAVSEDPLGASIVGSNVEGLYFGVANLAAVLACIAGVIMSLEQDLRFDMGLHAILSGMVAAIIGGVGNVPAAVAGGFLLGVTESISVWFLPAGYKRVVTFGILILFLLLRPRGLWGAKSDAVRLRPR